MIRFISRIFFWVCFLGLVFFVGTNIWVFSSTSKQLYQELAEVPAAPIGLVLGTSPLTTNGTPNPYFESRIEATASLFHQNKISHVIVSGHDGGRYYNEPLRMQQALIEVGVPESAITLDHEGFRTLDSMIRCSEVFDQDDVMIITQSFHAYRALFIGNYLGMDVHAFAANKVSEGSVKVTIREYFARSLAVWELYVSGSRPEYFGKIETL